MIVEVEDFGISWEKSDKTKHKADFDDLIRAYEKLEKIEHIICDIGECDELADTLENKVYEFCEHYQNDCNKCMIQRIEQIIKG